MRDQDLDDALFIGVHAMSKTTSFVPSLMFFFVWIAAFAFMLHAA
jgi:hypothetical protein